MGKLWTPPPTFTDASKLRAGDLDTYGRDNLQVLRDRPGAMAQFSSGSFLNDELKAPKSQWFALPLNDERRDSGGLHSNESSPSRITIPDGSTGMWFLAGHAHLFSPTFGPAIGTERHVGIRVNGSLFVANNSRFPDPNDVHFLSVATAYPMGAGDYLELCTYHDSDHDFYVTNVEGNTPELRAQFLCELFTGYVPSWKGLKTWASTEVLTAAHLNDQLRDNPGFLRYRPAAALTHSAAQNITNNAWNNLGLDILRGQNGVWNGTANALTVPAGCAGLYMLSTGLAIDAATGGLVRAVGATVNGTIVLTKNFTGFGASLPWGPLSAVRLVRLAVGDVVRLQGFQDSGATVATRTDYPVHLSLVWMAP